MKSKLLLFFFLTSCVRYTPEPVKTPQASHWKDTQIALSEATPYPEAEVRVDAAKLGAWWTVYGDTKLDELQALAIKNSPTLQQAVAKLKEAEAYYGIQRSEQFPHVDLDLNYQRQRLSETSSLFLALEGQGPPTTGMSARSPNPLEGPPLTGSLLPTLPPPCSIACPPPPAQTFSPLATTLTITPTVSYEFDFWGKYLQASESAQNMVLAQTEDLTTALLILTSNVADTYLQLRTYDDEVAVLEKNYDSRDLAYKLQDMRYKAGLIDNLDLQRAVVELTSIQADLESSTNQRALLENLLGLLVGIPAPEFRVEPASIQLQMPRIVAGLPSSLLQNRPDIKSASFQIEAMRLNVGVAKTAYFPAVTLLGNYGYQSSTTHNLFKWKSHIWSLTVDALTPIFDAGKIKNQVRQAVAQYEQSVSGYVQTVLTAFREVEDALGTLTSTNKELTFLDEQVVAAEKVFTLSTTRYSYGLIDYLDVVTAETSMLESQLQQVRVTRNQYSATISLIKSLGGVWEQKSVS